MYKRIYIHICAIWWTVRKIKSSTSVNYLLFVIVVVIVVAVVVVAFVVLGLVSNENKISKQRFKMHQIEVH